MEENVIGIPLYGKLVTLLKPAKTREKQRWHFQLLIADSEERVAGKVWGNSEEQLSHYQKKLVLDQYYILFPYTVADRVYGNALDYTFKTSFNLNHYDKLVRYSQL